MNGFERWRSITESLRADWEAEHGPPRRPSLTRRGAAMAACRVAPRLARDVPEWAVRTLTVDWQGRL